MRIDDRTCLELAGVVLELRDLGDLKAEIAIFSDGRYEVLSSCRPGYLISEAYVYSCTGESDINPDLLDGVCVDKVIKYRPILDRISTKLHRITLPGDGEFLILPLLDLLV